MASGKHTAPAQDSTIRALCAIQQAQDGLKAIAAVLIRDGAWTGSEGYVPLDAPVRGDLHCALGYIVASLDTHFEALDEAHNFRRHERV